MKNDTTTIFLNFALAALLLLSLTFAIMANYQTNKLTLLNAQAQQAGVVLARLQSLANDAAVYNLTAKSPELTRILQSAQAKPAAH